MLYSVLFFYFLLLISININIYTCNYISFFFSQENYQVHWVLDMLSYIKTLRFSSRWNCLVNSGHFVFKKLFDTRNKREWIDIGVVHNGNNVEENIFWNFDTFSAFCKKFDQFWKELDARSRDEALCKMKVAGPVHCFTNEK